MSLSRQRSKFIESKESKESTDMYKTSNVYPSTVRPSNLHRTWQKDNMTWTTITTPRKRVKSMKRHVQITNSLPSRPRRCPHSLGEFVRFCLVRCVMGMIVWIVRDVESDVLVLWFDDIKTNIDRIYCYINRSHTDIFSHSKDREILLRYNRIAQLAKTKKKKLTKTTIEKVLNVCKYVTRVDLNCSVCVWPWFILGSVLSILFWTKSYT